MSSVSSPLSRKRNSDTFLEHSADSLKSSEHLPDKNSLLAVIRNTLQTPPSPRSKRICNRASLLATSDCEKQRIESAVFAARRILVAYQKNPTPLPLEYTEEKSNLEISLVSSLSGPLAVIHLPLGSGSKKIVYLGVDHQDARAVLCERAGRSRFDTLEMDENETLPVERGLQLIRGPTPHLVIPEVVGDGFGYKTDLFEKRTWRHFFESMPLEQCQVWLKKFIPEIAQGIWELHRLNLVHGDIKPDNLLVGSSFGKAVSDELEAELCPSLEDKQCPKWLSRVTDLDSIFCVRQGVCPPVTDRTIIYLPPQYNSQKLDNWLSIEPDYDPRGDDVWALGVSVFKVLTQRLPPILRDVKRNMQAFFAIEEVWSRTEEFALQVRQELTELGVEQQLLEDTCAMLEPTARRRPAINRFLPDQRM